MQISLKLVKIRKNGLTISAPRWYENNLLLDYLHLCLSDWLTNYLNIQKC